jgi:Fe-S cluster assembly scaffold protein SufB
MMIRLGNTYTFLLACWLFSCPTATTSFLVENPNQQYQRTSTSSVRPLFVSIGLGPDPKHEKQHEEEVIRSYTVPNHDDFRFSRRSKLDEQCDRWFGTLLERNNNNTGGCLGALADAAHSRLTARVPVTNPPPLPNDDVEWTPYVSTKLPWTPLTVPFGLEQYGIPVPRRNAEAWRHFDVAGLVAHDYSGSASVAEMKGQQRTYRERLQAVGGWLSDDECEARLVYVNGCFVSELSKTTLDVYNMDDVAMADDYMTQCLARLTDGFTDELAAPVANGPTSTLQSFEKLSGPDHNVGPATSQFAMNAQQGTAAFCALNTAKCSSVAVVRGTAAVRANQEGVDAPRPVLIVQAQTATGGAALNTADQQGVAMHPRTLVIAEANSRLSVVQSCVDLDEDEDSVGTTARHRPKLYNGYTQIFVHEHANVTHSYLEEMGGIVTAGVEQGTTEAAESSAAALHPRDREAARPALADSHLEAIDVHITGSDGYYSGTIMSLGGSGRVRIAHSCTLLHMGASSTVHGFSLSGGSQRTDVRTNVHHIAQGTTSRQVQKNMIGGRAVGAFRGRVRVEQSAQQTDSAQLCRTVLLSDRARAWAVPSLEIVADDVQCAHGATVSDLSEEELFYLRARGLSVNMARNLLMYGFFRDISATVDPAMLGALDSPTGGLQKRVLQRLENLVPRGERAVQGEYQSI